MLRVFPGRTGGAGSRRRAGRLRCPVARPLPSPGKRGGRGAVVWSGIGAISQVCRLPVNTAVTCPTVRVHPAVIAQAAATASLLLDGRFVRGGGRAIGTSGRTPTSGWMLEEAADAAAGNSDGFVSHRGTHYTVDDAKLYSKPASPPPVYVSGFGPKAIKLAGRIGDGYVSTMPDKDRCGCSPTPAVPASPPRPATRSAGAATTTPASTPRHRLWANSSVPGELRRCCPAPSTSSRPASWSPGR